MNKKGFTLIELLAVITIMGILMMVAIPSVSWTIEKARQDSFVNVAKAYANSAKNLWTADGLLCGSDAQYASSMVDGDYFVLIDSSDSALNSLLETGGLSPWGNKDVKGYVRIRKSIEGKDAAKYYIALTDGIHAIYDDPDNPKEVDLIKRTDIIQDITGEVDKLKNINEIPFVNGRYTTCNEQSVTWTGTSNYGEELIGYSYNGVILPKIETKEGYPYQYIFEVRGTERIDSLLRDYGYDSFVGQLDLVYGMHYSTHPYVYEGSSRFSTTAAGSKTIGYAFDPTGILSTDSWGYTESYEISTGSGSYGNPSDTTMIWSNTNLLNPDGSVYLAASEPTPIYG